MSRVPDLVLGIILGLAGAASVVLAVGAGEDTRRDRRAREFHGLVGGLGFGPAFSLEPCASAFDPRLCPACPMDTGPVPGGKVFCSHHAGSVLVYPPLGNGN